MSSRKTGRMQVNWEIYPRSLYIIHEVRSSKDEGTRVELLAECTAPAQLTGHFRWAFGGGNVETQFRASRIVDVDEDLWIDINIKAEDISIRENSCAGQWEDLSDWVAKDKIGVLKNDVSARDEFLGKHTFDLLTPNANSEHHK